MICRIASTGRSPTEAAEPPSGDLAGAPGSQRPSSMASGSQTTSACPGCGDGQGEAEGEAGCGEGTSE